ncbi:MAG: hypothetical protein KZQ78_04465 [Candidatus Thiodiazotropha sp. (ex Ustalcina ferruginea)]|nr:hypothetical protein [Candidatus Thiodiazotropha sp. (ex Ustalcina ferruginea)]
MPQWIILIVLSLSSAVIPADEISNGCLKRVFMHYCLGGSMTQLLQQRPVNLEPVVDGDRTGIIYTKGRERIYVMAYQGHIYKVLQTYDSPNQVTLQRIQRTLHKKYGNHQDMSVFPNYVRNIAGRIGAVRRGEGELRYRWQLPGSPWRVELAWTRKLGISLAYLANALDQQQREAGERSL